MKLGGVPMQGIYNCLNAVKHLLDYNNFSDKKELQNFKLANTKIINLYTQTSTKEKLVLEQRNKGS